ncbi:MAG: DUF2277 domain-containing protein [Dehalococcoidia bacterium]|nr:DUF2277 domain-containing protein [Dehalococcoidia bacterium]
MCRSIKRLRQPKGSEQPPATHEEIHAAALQFVQKVSDYQLPAPVNAPAFELAVEGRDVAAITEGLLVALPKP